MTSTKSAGRTRGLLGRLLGVLITLTTIVAIGLVVAPPAAAVMGDGVIDAGEECDDDNVNAGDGCDGTGLIEHGFACTGAPSICSSTQGDGVVASDENCDDGNLEDDDGCTSIGMVEHGFVCTGEPSECASEVGDGQVASNEECDDGDLESGDGCDITGSVEVGWMCEGEPSTCYTTMGDGVIAGGEECDDGNVESGDGCDSGGGIEAFYECSGQPSVCTLLVVTNLTAPSIRGRAVVGETLTARRGTWEQEGLTFTYRWYVDGDPVGPASATKTLRVRRAYVGDKIRVLVKATKSNHMPGKALSPRTNRVRR